MKTRRFGLVGMVMLAVFVSVPAWAQVEVTVEELDIGGNPPALEGMPGVFLTNQDTGTDHLVIFGGCTEDWLWDQALVLDDVSGGFDGLSWTTVPVPGMGLACEHVVAGPGDVAYLIGGYKDGWDTLRPMNEILEIRLAGNASNPVLETATLSIPCTDCPVPRIGFAATWSDSLDECDGAGGVVIVGGMDGNWELLDDVWTFCPGSGQLKVLESDLWEAMGDLLFGAGLEPDVVFHQSWGAIIYLGEETHGGRNILSVFRRAPDGMVWIRVNNPDATNQPVGRWAMAATETKGGVLVLCGTKSSTGEIVREVWWINLWTGEWTQLPDFIIGVANVAQVVLPGIFKVGGSTQSILFGGVQDYRAPRTLSNSTYLVTVTETGPAAHFAVPAVARVRGSGAFFTSLMHLYAAGTADLELEMSFTPRDGSGGSVTTVDHTVPAGVMQTIEDPLETLFGFSGGAGRVGSVLITVTSGSAADLMAQTVVFAELDSGEEYGQFFPAMPIGDAISSGQTAYLNTSEDPSHNRVNIGLMAVADDTRFRVRPVDPLSSGLAAPMTFDLDTGGNTQINNLHSTFGLGTMANVVVEVEVLAGSGFAYASVLDGSGAYSGTSDPTTILPSLAGAGKVTLLEIGSIQGLNEFSGSASITNYSNRSATVRADFFQRGESGVRTTENLTIAAGDTVGYSDLGADLFGVSGDVGSVVLTSTNNTRIGATGREFAIFRDAQSQVVGTAGQLIAGQTDGDRLAAGSTHHFIGLRQERGSGAVERSHFAVYNPAWGDAEVTVRLYDGASGTLEGERSWVVERRTLIQVNNVIRAINSGYDGDDKRIEVEVDKPVFMNAFRVNRWGDPVTLSPFED